MIPVILSGGSGKRLWPLSTKNKPKQFLKINNVNTLFENTILRLQQITSHEPIIICQNNHKRYVMENLCNINAGAHAILTEPLSKNTAPAIAAACLFLQKNNDDPVVTVFPSDQHIEDTSALKATLKTAEKYAEKGHIVALGIQPHEAHTGYGYIQKGKQDVNGSYHIAAFKEKPCKEKAERFYNTKQYLWNSGIFCFKASVLLNEIAKFKPELLHHLKKSVQNASQDQSSYALDKDLFAKIENISIDHAVMESTDLGFVVELNSQWADIGNWDSVFKISSKDKNNNVILEGRGTLKNSQNNLVHVEGKDVILIGVDDLIIVENTEGLLIMKRGNAESVKNITDEINAGKKKS